jgi:TRAP-type C4-dicarboxylate transport system permease small subunit
MKKVSISALLDIVAGALFLFMFLVFIVEVFFRYVLNSPISWTIEIIMVSFLLMMFWTLTFSVPLKRHVAFTVVRDLLPPGGKRVFALVVHLACAAVLVVALPGIVSIAWYELREGTPILRIPLIVNYGAFAMFVAAYVIRVVVSVIHLLRRGWRAEV